MDYLSQFDENGKLLTSVCDDESLTPEEREQKIADGYVEITAEDWNYYIGNMGGGANGSGYIRGADGKPTDAPPHQMTVEELDAQYDSDKATLVRYYGEAALAGDAETQAELMQELNDLNAEYDEKRREIEGE